jgi:heptosyltransferase II
MKILLIKQTSLGDVIHSSLAIEATRAQYLDAEIHFMVDKSCKLAVENNPHIDKLIIFDKILISQKMKKSFLNIFSVMAQFMSSLREVRKQKYDLAIDLQGIERSLFFLYFCRAKAKFVKGKKPFLKGFKNADKNDHAIAELKGTLKLAGIDGEKFFPKIYLKEGGEAVLKKKLPQKLKEALEDKNQQVILMSPYTSWETKDYPVKNYLRSAQMIQKNYPQAQFIFIGTPDKKEAIDNEIIDSKLESEFTQKTWNLAGCTNIQELQELIRLADLTIASEGAVGHIASALDRPVCVIFGPTQPTRVGPWGNHARVIRSKEAKCLACYQRFCDEWICMNNLEEQISQAAKDLLK